MVTAKLTSIFGGFLYLFIFIIAFLYSDRFNGFISNSFGVANTSLFALIIASAFFFAVGNFSFSYFIQQREKYHQALESAFFFSLQLLIIPAILFIGYLVIFVSLNK